MAYPEPVPAISGRNAKKFLARLKAFKLKSSQLAVYRDARENYRKKAHKK